MILFWIVNATDTLCLRNWGFGAHMLLKRVHWFCVLWIASSEFLLVLGLPPLWPTLWHRSWAIAILYPYTSPNVSCTLWTLCFLIHCFFCLEFSSSLGHPSNLSLTYSLNKYWAPIMCQALFQVFGISSCPQYLHSGNGQLRPFPLWFNTRITTCSRIISQMYPPHSPPTTTTHQSPLT